MPGSDSSSETLSIESEDPVLLERNGVNNTGTSYLEIVYKMVKDTSFAIHVWAPGKASLATSFGLRRSWKTLERLRSERMVHL